MNWLKPRRTIAMVGAACLMSLVVFCFLKYVEFERRSEARELGQRFALRLVERISETSAGVYMLTAAVDRQTGKVSRFDELADELLANFPLMRVLELAPGGVIWHVHPLRGNEVVVGHDLLLDKTRNREVHLAVTRRQMAIAGPLVLRQGGVGILARYPLFTVGPDGRSRFWGLSIGVIDFPSLLLMAGEGEFAQRGYGYEICWKPLGSEHCRNLNGEPVVVSSMAENMDIGLSQAEWHLAVSRPGGWLSVLELSIGLLVVVAGTLGAGFLVRPSDEGVPAPQDA
ncbi:CHASE domain-containing protein [uncultured Dechloromonas sp.]|uniref:CHASE domain-containing protein n=1 Tax=uncultured Dechloromonas sp. TaxID=171719 RepID=UPI0025EB3B8F|nr:CHASE domain-containing protein [uncultured Dechloromonas sp.]